MVHEFVFLVGCGRAHDANDELFDFGFVCFAGARFDFAPALVHAGVFVIDGPRGDVSQVTEQVEELRQVLVCFGIVASSCGFLVERSESTTALVEVDEKNAVASFPRGESAEHTLVLCFAWAVLVSSSWADAFVDASPL